MELQFLALAAVGLVLSVYITLYRLDLVPLVCPRGRFVNCERVLDERPSVLGIPTYAGGAAFFAIELALAYLSIGPFYMLLYNASGLVPASWLLLMQWRLRAVCVYCMAVHAAVIASFALSLLQFQPH